MIVVAVALGLLVGLSLGALGGGGSTLAVPILVFVAGMDAQAATTASLLVVGVAAIVGAWRHHRLGTVHLGVGFAFGAAGIAGSRIGTTVNQSIDEHALLLAFSVLVAFVAIRMYRTVGQCTPATADMPSYTDRTGRPCPPDVSSTTDTAAVATAPARPQTRLDLSMPQLARLAVAATAVGVLTGLFGVGGGFAVVPALTLLLGFSTKDAIGTSLVVIAINAGLALSMRAGELDGVDWSVVVPFLALVTAGVVAGSRLADRLDADRLTRGFAVMLGAVALYTAISTIAA